MSLLCWNARGLGDPRAIRRFRLMIRKLSPSFVFVSETKISGNRISALRHSLGFLNGFGVDSVGCKGGLALFWHPDWQVDIKSFGPSHIDSIITDPTGLIWRFTGFYGNPIRHQRHHSWELIRRLTSHFSLPWLMGGYFNEILHLSEKEWGANCCSSSMTHFRDTLNQCGLLDLGFSGSPFTWSNKQQFPFNILERIDRYIATFSWKSLFRDSRITHEDFFGSDHRVIKLEFWPLLSQSPLEFGQRTFRFEPYWQLATTFPQLIEHCWSDKVASTFNSTDLTIHLKRCGQVIKKWSLSTFGDIGRRIKLLHNELSYLNSQVGSYYHRNRIRCLENQLDYLLALNEAYWKQRSRADWLAGGDRNTKFFHHKASVRKHNNRIHGILSPDNGWIYNSLEVNAFISNYFINQFASSTPSQHQIDCAISGLETKVTNSMNSLLDALYTEKEVAYALFGMAPWKSPGPDGFHAGFFQKNWDVVRDDITSVCLRILNGNMSIGDLNSTYLVLIPKVKNPKMIKDYRPISLCNVTSKIVAKAMANRIKMILPDIIDVEQSAFVHGRFITDNILIAFECVHSIKKRSNGRNGLMSIKLDMNKAFDRVEWGYLVAVMSRLGFSSKWINSVTDFLRSTRFSILINGRPSGFFTPSRGLRQGCPLSPYLFLLCSQGFSSLLKQQAVLGTFKGIRCARHAPTITHLFFADDTLLFGHTDQSTCLVLKQVIKLYEDGSGQSINLQKSSIIFSPNTTYSTKQQTFSTLNMQYNESYDAYLGLPAFSGRNKQRLFDGLREKVWSKLQSWKSKLFSIGGREILIKAVAQAIPSYTMSIFRLPAALCHRLRSMIVNFWWGAKGSERKLHWRRWNLLCMPKMNGGMGFRDLIPFNQALLAKQAWRILTNPNSISAQIYRYKYFPAGDFLKAKCSNNSSYAWRSLIWGRDLLSSGLRWRIGNGLRVKVFQDPWLLRPLTFKPITSPTQNSQCLLARELMHESGGWNSDILNDVFWDIDRDEILRIPVGTNYGEDKLIWHYAAKGEYTVRSGYHLAMSTDESISTGYFCGYRNELKKLCP